MVEIKQITEEDKRKFQTIFSSAHRTLGWDVEDSVKVVQDCQEFLLFYCNQVFMKFSFDSEGRIHRNTIQIDEEGKILAFTITQEDMDYQVMVDDGKIHLIDENHFHQSLQLRKDEQDSTDFEVSSNGLLDYVQYDAKKDLQVVMRYEQPIHSSVCDKTLYAYYIKEPYFVSYEDHVQKRHKGFFFLGRKDAYYRMDFDLRNNKWQYDLATLFEHGVGAVMAKDTFSLQDNQVAFSRFYRVLFHVGDYITMTGFPFLQSHRVEEVEEWIREMQLHSSIPTFVVDLFNQRFVLLREYQEMVDAYLAFQYGEKELKKEKK